MMYFIPFHMLPYFFFIYSNWILKNANWVSLGKALQYHDGYLYSKCRMLKSDALILTSCIWVVTYFRRFEGIFHFIFSFFVCQQIAAVDVWSSSQQLATFAFAPLPVPPPRLLPPWVGRKYKYPGSQTNGIDRWYAGNLDFF